MVSRALAVLFGGLHLDDLLNPIVEHPHSRRRFQVLVYHKVSPDPHPFFEPVTPLDFERQIIFLKQHYLILDLEELVDRSVRGEIPKKAVAITFDDGYRDNYEFAFPVLRKHGVPATIFLATSAIDNRQKLWHDRIFDAFRFAKDGGGRLVLRDIIREAKSMCSKERLGVVERVEETLAPEVPVEFRSQMLSWTQVTDMHRAGIRFGSHTCTHPILSREEPQEVLRELHESKAEIEERLGTRTALLAYPNGQKQDFSSEIEDTVRKVGYKSAFTTLPGYNTADDNAYALKRGKPWQNELNLFRLHLFLQRLDHRR